MKNLNELSKRIDELKYWEGEDENGWKLGAIKQTLTAMLGELKEYGEDDKIIAHDIQKLIDKINNQKGGEQK